MKKIVILFVMFSLSLLAEANNHDYTELEKNYIDALHNHDLEKVKKSVESKVNINLLTPSEMPPLIYLLNGIPLFGNTQENDLEREQVLNYLIDKGIDVNAANDVDDTVLHYAIHHAMYSVIDNLMKHNVNISVEAPPIFSIVRLQDPLKMLHYLEKNKVGKVTDLAKDKTSLLHEAVDTHKDMSLIKYLSNKIPLEGRGKDDNTVLLQALNSSKNYSQYDDVTVDDVAKFLIEQGADVNVEDKDGFSALMLALINSYSYETIKLLLDKGSEIKKGANNGYMPIQAAIANYDDSKILELFIDRGIKIMDVDVDDKNTLLHIAVITKKEKSVKYLLDNKIDIDAKNRNGKTALNIAIEKSFPNIITMLKKKNAKFTDKEELEKIDKINKAEDKDKKNKKKQEINNIRDAIRLGKFEKVKAYYENDSSLKLKLIELAMYSVRKNNMKSLEYFLEKGLDVHAVDKENYNLLQQAVYYNKIDMIEFFIKQGIKINSFEDDTPSNFSLSSHCSVETFKYLIEKGMKAQEGDKEKIIRNALYDGNSQLARYLLSQAYTLSKSSLKSDELIVKIAQRGDIEAVKILLENKFDIETKVKRTFREMPMLIYSIKFEQYELTKFLLSKNANVFVEVDNTSDALASTIIESGKLALLDLLLKKGYGIDYKDEKNPLSKTLLDIAFDRKKPKAITFLINKGANIEADINHNLAPPLFYAVEFGYLEIAKLLIEKGADRHYRYTDRSDTSRSLAYFAHTTGHKEIANYFDQLDKKK